MFCAFRPRRLPSLVLVLALLLVLAGCSSSKKQRGGSDRPSRPRTGKGCGDLIPIRATKTPDGIAAQNRWLREHFGEFRKKGQELIFCDNGKQADRIEIELPDGREVVVFFDISRFFGKY